MFHLCKSVLPVRLREGAWEIEASGSWHCILESNGIKPATLGPGWSVASCLDMWGLGYLLLLKNESGAGAAWVLDSAERFVSDFDWLSSAVSEELFVALAAAATGLLRELRLNPVPNLKCTGLQEVLSIHPHVIGVFAKLAAKSARTVGTSSVSITSGHWTGILSADRIEKLLLDEQEFIDLIKGGRLMLPSLSGKGDNEVVALIDRSIHSPIYYVREAGTGTVYYLYVSPSGDKAIYLPEDNLLVAKAIGISAGEVLAAIDGGLAKLASELFRQKITQIATSNSVGLFTSGIPNFGHAIWDEFQAIERVIAASPSIKQHAKKSFFGKKGDTGSASPPWLYHVEANSGIELYGAVEELYPELAGRVIKAQHETAFMAKALGDGISIVLRTGQRATLESRKRIMKVVNADAVRSGLASTVSTIIHEAGAPLVITLGLRLSNRTPVNMMEIYTDLVRKLHAIYGHLIVVFDGMNGSDDPTKAATVVFNGVTSANASFLEAIRDGSDEISKEKAWIAEFESKVSDLGLTIVSCIGTRIRNNLYWMSRSNYFVAPLGGGLAKLRWAMDIPGYVLSSKVNLELCLLLHAYDDESQMDGPFTPLSFNSAEEVEDLPLVPPRETPAIPHGIPHPENFTVSPAVVDHIVTDIQAYWSPPVA
jgi:hypothetical protein